MYTAKVITRQGKKFVVQDAEQNLRQCHVRSQVQDAVCGDVVICESKSQGLDIITTIEPRFNQLTRIDSFKREKTLAANIDHMLIVIAAKPEFSTLLIDKYLACARLNKCRVSLVINKAELISQHDIDINSLANMYNALVDHFIIVSAKLGYGVATLKSVLVDETHILVGQSGVGKSSLINRLLDTDELRVASLSESIEQGKHTTTSAQTYTIAQAGRIIDSPGVRSFTPIFNSAEKVMSGFIEFQEFAGQCKFANCMHINEPECAVKNAVTQGLIFKSRYESYKQLLSETEDLLT